MDRYPVVCCLRELPAGMPTGNTIAEPVRVAAFAFKSYVWPLPSADGAARQREAPLLIGGDVAWVRPAATSRGGPLDWMLAVREILEKCDLAGADLAGSSVGASLVLEAAALWPAMVRRAAVVAPFGLFDEKDPPTDPWAQRADQVPGLMCADPEIYKAMKAIPEGANSIEWPIEQVRAAESAARIFWPLGNTKIDKRLRLINCPVLLMWGENDRIMPRSYANTFAAGISGKTETKIIPGAGHLAELDNPAEVAKAILAFTA